MDKQETIQKLKELGIDTKNVYSKKTFLDQGIVVVAMFESEVKEDFFFWNERDSKIYKLPSVKNIKKYTFEAATNKYLIPLTEFTVFWEDKPYEEHPDKPFSQMTLREYACIHLKVAESGCAWLDVLIKNSK